MAHKTKEARAAYLREWRRRNPEKKREYDISYLRRHGGGNSAHRPPAQNDEERRLRRREYDATRTARIRETAIGRVSYAAIRRASPNCGICGAVVEDYDLSFDHIIPLAAGGPHIQSNIQVAHRKCNSRKGGTADRVLARKMAV